MLAIPDAGVFVIADGMGGEVAGEEASAQTISSIDQALRPLAQNPPANPDQLELLLQDALMQAHRDVFDISKLNPLKRGMGSTASLLCVHRDAWMVAQIGDSRVYLIRNGLIRQITTDHTVVWELYKQGIIERDQLALHPTRHLLTQCIGSSEPIKIDLFEGAVRNGDMFLICSDGLTGYVPEEQLNATLVDPALDLDQMADELVESALAGGGGDNISLILLRVHPDPGDRWLAMFHADQTSVG
ncbi:protein phosphatase 2C domain-containing protein [bacterium]|nr:protein phosphatase 2C domain-containing protein [bacterium]